jgi:hypothetical protein
LFETFDEAVIVIFFLNDVNNGSDSIIRESLDKCRDLGWPSKNIEFESDSDFDWLSFIVENYKIVGIN